MEEVFHQPIVVEFNGLPGTGKSTITSQLVKEIEDKGVVVNYEYYRNNFSRRGYFILLCPKYWLLMYYLLVLAWKIHADSKIKWSLFYIHYIKMYRDFLEDNNEGMLLIDQGIVQTLISLFFQTKMSDTTSLQRVLKKSGLDKVNIAFINCNVDVAISNERIKGRPSNRTRLELMNDTERIKTLLVQKENFIFFRSLITRDYSNIHSINIETNKTIQNNVDCVLDALKLTHL